MKKTLLVGLCLTAALTGCGGGAELNDENFVDYYIESVHVTMGLLERYEGSFDMASYYAEAEQAHDELLEKYGWSYDDMDRYSYELVNDEERFDKVIGMIGDRGEPHAARVLADNLRTLLETR